jgi:hypothetical protein
MRLSAEDQSRLEKVLNKFVAFRASRSRGRGPLPLALWDEAIALTASISPIDVARVLKVDPRSLAQRVAKSAKKEASSKSLAMVRVAPVVVNGSTIAQTMSEASLEITKADGTKLCLRGLTREDVALTLTRFLGGATA